MINAGDYNKKITIIKTTITEDSGGFDEKVESVVLRTHAKVKTTKGFTLIASNSDFESAETNFTIRFPKVKITRDMIVRFNERDYQIDYLNNIDEKGIELEIQAKEVTK